MKNGTNPLNNIFIKLKIKETMIWVYFRDGMHPFGNVEKRKKK